jgi:hypothetical protein
MADKKISALTGATTPLAGTEVLPIVQSGATVKVATNDLTVRNFRANATTGILQVTGPTAASTRVMTVPDANFTAARTDAAQSFTGDQTLSTGNLVIGTSGKGVDFSATSGTGTSELFADYEEGTWTPAGNGFGGLTVTFATYTKTGRAVTVTFDVTFPSLLGNTDLAYLAGLPFIPATNWSGSGALGYRGSVSMVALQVDLVNTANGSINIYKTGTTNAQNTDVSSSRIVGTVTYFV